MSDIYFAAFAAHFPAVMSQDLCDYARDVAFLYSRYLFTRREGKRQFGYCTHCRQENETSGLRHGESTKCQACGSECSVKASGKGRKYMVDEAYFVYYEKSLVNPNAITARGLYAVRDYREDYRDVETLVEVKAMYLFEPGSSVMVERPWLWYSDTNGMSMGERWSTHKTVSSLSNSIMSHKPCYCSRDSIRTAVQGTPFQYSTWEQYQSGDMVKFFDLAAKYPCVEYLTKLGMSRIVDAKLNGDKTYGVVNWRARSPLKVLRMTKQELNNLRTTNVTIDPWYLYLWSVSKKDGSNYSFADLTQLSAEISGWNDSNLRQALKMTSLRKLMTYLSKQLRKPEVRKYYTSKSQLLSTWNDYMADCVSLTLDTSNETVKFPRNLYDAHQNTIAQVKVKEVAALQRQITSRCKALQKLRFEANGFVLRPATSSKELIEEGKALEHCVGRYAPEYAKGEKDLFVLRMAAEPDKPFYTLELRGGHVTQCRGLKNCVPTKEVRAFIELFVSKKLLTKKRTRVGIAV